MVLEPVPPYIPLMSRRRGTRTCRHCRGPIEDRGLIFCKPLCRASAKLERDREYSRLRRQESPPRRTPVVDDEPPMPRVEAVERGIQPRALTVVQQRAAAFVRWCSELPGRLALFCFERGYTERDHAEILRYLHGETEVAPEEIPPDPPADVFADVAQLDPIFDD